MEAEKCLHENWEGENPRFQKCTACGIQRPRVQNINEGELGRIYWDGEWQKRGVQENVYPRTFELILSQIQEGDKVVDIGCGTGSFAREFRKKFPVEQFNKKTIYGMDISPYAIKKCTHEILEFYGYVGQFPEDAPLHFWFCFDVVVCTEFLEHATNDENAARWLSKLLKDKDGILFLSVPDNTLPPETEAEHQRTYTMESLDALLHPFFDNVHIIRIKEEEKLLAVCQERKG